MILIIQLNLTDGYWHYTLLIYLIEGYGLMLLFDIYYNFAFICF